MAEDITEASAALFQAAGTAALVTLRRDGRPQLSNVAYTYEATGRLFRISTTDGRAKTANLRRDPRASLFVTTPDSWSYAVAEGVAELTPVAADPQDTVVDELVPNYLHRYHRVPTHHIPKSATTNVYDFIVSVHPSIYLVESHVQYHTRT